jgi:AAA15 family ATPase/GTPase
VTSACFDCGLARGLAPGWCSEDFTQRRGVRKEYFFRGEKTMAINRVEFKEFEAFLVFKSGFAADFCDGVNVLIGGNATGKTTLLKRLYIEKPSRSGLVRTSPYAGTVKFSEVKNCVYIPEKDILEHAKGLLSFIEQKQTGFDQIYKGVLLNAQDVPTQKQSETQKRIGQKITDMIGGNVRWDQGDGIYYTVRTDGTRIPFANEASGYKKLGFLGLLVTSGQLESGSVLFWDEPENSLNPELVPQLVDILLDLSRNGVQIFIATHSEILASYFGALRKDNDKVMFFSLFKDDYTIKFDSSERFDLLTPNNLSAEQAKLYEREIERGLGK